MNNFTQTECFQNTKETPINRIKSAKNVLSIGKYSQEQILFWISNTIQADKTFHSSPEAWELFSELLLTSNLKEDHFSFQLYPMILSTAYSSSARIKAFNAMEILLKKYPHSWRPSFQNLVKATTECLKLQNIYPDQFLFFKASGAA